ncbi:hypothetical protein B0H19DRAFT_1185057 [Mycena capillaripes]|nr:hypothetical protein B0H19DRAFT_1185057 [Mycena capillaripes]
MHLVSLRDIPPELLTEILGFLDAKTVLLSSSVCKSWHETVWSSPELQYTIELWVDGMVRGPSGWLTSSETLEALYKHRRAWQSLEWKSKTTVAAESLRSSHTYELAGGVFAQGPNFLAISLAKIVDEPENARVNHDIGDYEVDDFQDLAIDPTQDLVAFLHMTPGEPRARVHLHTISSHQSHPLAAIPCLLFALERDATMPLSIQIVDDIIGIFIGEPSSLTIFNWRSGITIATTIIEEQPFSVADFKFLSSRSYLLVHGFDPAQPSGLIKIFTFEGTCPNSPIHVATLQLPELFPARRISLTLIQTGPFCANPISGTPFSKSNDRRIFVFVIDYGGTPELQYRLVVRHRYLHGYVLDHVRRGQGRTDSATVVPWEEWGPRNSRMLPMEDLIRNGHVHGERVAVPCENPRLVQVLDFGVIPGRASAARDTGTELHLASSTLEVIGIFRKAVTTSLPYRSTLCSLDDEYDLLLMDQDRIIGIDLTETDDKQMTVYSL